MAQAGIINSSDWKCPQVERSGRTGIDLYSSTGLSQGFIWTFYMHMHKQNPHKVKQKKRTNRQTNKSAAEPPSGVLLMKFIWL